MNNEILELLRSLVGKVFEQTPSPLGQWLKGKIREVNEGEITVEYIVRKEMTNPAGGLHGGVISAIIDDTIGIAVLSLGRESLYTSVNLSVDFLSAAKEGDTIIATAKVVRRGRNVINAECLLYKSRDRLIAKGTSNLYRIS